jgi:nudix-type nucleoside diphosphatase (YffH/AdpP family)
MPNRVEISSKKRVFEKAIFRIDEITLRHENYKGGMSKEMTRLNLDRGDSVAAVVHNPTADTLLLTEQFRLSTYDKGPSWLMEIPAGMISKNEPPDQAMRREIEEEIGYRVTSLRPIFTFYLSPGATSERIFLFYAKVETKQKVGSGGGLVTEGEDIRLMELSKAEVFQKMDNGVIADAKTLVGLQWLRAQEQQS